MDAVGLSRSLVSWWNSGLDAIPSNVMNVGIAVEVRSKGLGKVYRIINAYWPYSDRKSFW